MRILAIRGSNITSLAGEFKLELDAAPLAGVGLFSITGPTGSGKSSLLDALCLALFGTAPRLDGQGSIRFGRHEDGDEYRLGASDPRSLVRRGASSGFAEVEYIGEGGHRFRARWEARRARNQMTGRFQDWTMQLENLDANEILGSKKTEVLKEIERTLGLSYQQFRRSALLAQGDFAAFLQEKGDRRAELLEQMTGAELYTRISKAAFQRAKEADIELSRLEDAISAVPMLDEEARRELEAKLSRLLQIREEQERELAKIELAARYYDELANFLRLESEAKDERKRAEEEQQSLLPLREELLRIERALPLRSSIDAEREASEKKARAEQQKAQAEARVELLRTELSRYRQSLATSETARRAASERLERARPDIEQASKLDALIREKERQLSLAHTQAQEAVSKRDEISRKLAELTARIGEESDFADETRSWLEVRASLMPLEAQWDLFQAELRRYIEAHREAKLFSEAKSALEQAEEAAKGALRQSEAALSDAKRVADEAKAEADRAEGEAAEATFSEGLREERDAIAARQKSVESMISACSQLDELARREAKERASEASSRLKTGEAHQAAAEAEAGLPKAEAELSEAKWAWEQTRATLDLEAHRARLREGDPCPLCGSEQHPYAKEGGPVAALLEAQAARVSDREAHLRRLGNELSSKRAMATELFRAAEEAKARAEEIAKAREDLVGSFAGLANDAEIANILPDAAGLVALNELAGGMKARLLELREAEKRASFLAIEAQKQQKAWQLAREDMEAKARSLEQSKERAREANLAVMRNAEKLATADAQLVKSADALSPGLEGRGDWREKLAENPEIFAKRRAKEVGDYRLQRERLGKLAEGLSKTKAEYEKTAAVLLERAEAASKLEGELSLREEALSIDKTARAALFEGQSTESIQAGLEAALAEANTALEMAQKSEREAIERAALAEREQTAAEVEEKLASDALTRASAELAARLEPIGMSREMLSACLLRDELWLSETKAKLEEVDHRLREASTRLEERTQRRTEHEGKSCPEMAEDEARTLLSTSREALKAAVDGLAEAQAELRRDDEARKLRANRSGALEEARQAAERWKALDSLIGSADGKKFRTFAQSLTLDALVAYANEHLRDLAPRYRLMRVPGHDMELQVVDSDMGDEVRGTNSLSGGETFLVSLALALSLSSLAARDVRIDTLFIDEGFGSLDPNTLDMAIAALESLQATGRQVGVISHVRAMADKIGTQVRVQKLGAGKSRVVLNADAAAGYEL